MTETVHDHPLGDINLLRPLYSLPLVRKVVVRERAPVSAFYWWKGEVEAAQEWRISYMTSTDRLPALEAWLHENHPFDVPQWITLPVTGGSEAYLSWVVEETHPQ
ncbi:divalent-cation tolerance protein CutA [Streptomyces avicenniae]|uniref:divalent-cation tolerance protein CutA n=1 Tax=Streptomyces avicenniae TaxID=500153 RepID=UPI000AA03A42|nr:divalent-cation tolerance protein CutA [Streptomyces avicenniae]